MIMTTVIKENTQLGLDFVHYNHLRKHGGMQAVMVMEKDLRVLHTILIGRQQEENGLIFGDLKPHSLVTQFLQESYTYSNKTMPLLVILSESTLCIQ